MALIQDWIPPTKEHYDTVLFYWKFFPLVRQTRNPIVPHQVDKFSPLHMTDMLERARPHRCNG